MAVQAQLGLHGREVLGRVRAVQRGEVEHVHEQPAALHVRQELVAESGARARPLDQAGDIGEHELTLVALERAEHRLDRREGIVGHLRLRAREAREQRRLAGVRQPDEPGVRKQPQAQLEPALLTRQAALGEARRLARRGGELPVAAAAGAATRDHGALPALRQVPAVAARGSSTTVPGGTRTSSGVGRRAVLARALSVAAASGLEVLRRA